MDATIRSYRHHIPGGGVTVDAQDYVNLDTAEQAITAAVAAERERAIRIVSELCGSHTLTERFRERINSAT